MIGRVLADREERRLEAFVASALSTAGVFSGHGPSSKVSTTSLSRRKSNCLKCSKPNPGPPVVSISTTRARPSATGLSHGGMAVAVAVLPALAASRGWAAGAGKPEGMGDCRRILGDKRWRGGCGWCAQRRGCRFRHLDDRCLNKARLSDLAHSRGRRRRTRTLCGRYDMCGESHERLRRGHFLRCDDPERRETQGHRRGNDNNGDPHHSLHSLNPELPHVIPVDSAEDVAIGPVDQVYPVARAARDPGGSGGRRNAPCARVYGR